MAKYQITAPNGEAFEITAPDTATEKEVLAYAQSQWSATPKTGAVSPKSPLVDTGALAATVSDLPRYGGMALNSAFTGVTDLAVGAGQLVSKVLPKSMEDRYSDAMRWRESEYQGAREGYGDQPDVGRFTGGLVAGGVAGAGAPAASLGGRILQGMKTGGAIGLVSPVDPDAGSYVTAKAIQTGGGALAGGASVPVVEGLIRGAGVAINALANQSRGLKNTFSGQASASTIQKTLETELKNEGVDWTALPQSMRTSLVNQVQKSLKSGGELDHQAIRRLAFFNKLDIKPTQGQLTRNPLDYAREVNYSKLEPGKPLAERFTEQNQAMIGTLDKVRGATGARAADPYAAGQSVIKNLKEVDSTRKATVDAAYTAARDKAGIETDVPLQPVADRLGKLLEDFGAENVPSPVTKRLQEFGLIDGKQTRVFNIREAEKLKTLIGNNIENPNSPAGKALTLLKQSVDDAVNSLSDNAGSEAAQAFTQARKLAADRFTKLDKAPGLANAVSREPMAPEKFIESHVVRGEIQDVANLLRNMKPEARAEVRAAVVDWIRARAVNGAEDTAKYTQAGFSKAIKALGPRKLELIFAGDAKALDTLRSLESVGAYVQSPPIASGVNYSNTATTGADFLDQLGRLPVLGLLGRPGDIWRSHLVANSLAGAAPTQAANPLLSAGLIDAAGILGAQAAPIPSATTIPALLDQPYKQRLKR